MRIWGTRQKAIDVASENLHKSSLKKDEAEDRFQEAVKRLNSAIKDYQKEAS